jgi:uncharacterized surface anchored protein
MADFTQTDIELDYYTDDWGPYSFNFPIASSATANDGLLPYGTTIQSVSVNAYQGNVNRKSTLGDETEISGLVDADYTPTISGDDTVLVKFAHPGASYKTQKATLIFELTLSNGAKNAFYFQYVRIR